MKQKLFQKVSMPQGLRARTIMTLIALLCFAGGVSAQQDLPYEYGFENEDLTVDGWIANITSTYSGIYSDGPEHSGNFGFKFNYSEENGSLISPLLSSGNNQVEVSFWYKEYSAYYGDEQFQVGYTTDEKVTDPADFIYGEVITASLTWQQYENLFPAGTKRICVKYIYNDTYYLFLDDFSFAVPSPNPIPKHVEVKPTHTSATISWTGGSDSYEVKYKKAELLFFEDFENGLPETWTTIDNDGDGNNWYLASVDSHSGTSVVTSASFINNVGPLTPDNWLISPQLDLKGELSLWLKGQDPNYASEYFEVYVSTTGVEIDDFDTDTPLIEGTTTGEYVRYTANLNSFNGQKGYIAIRHFNCTDMYQLNLDDFGIYNNMGSVSEWTTLTTTETSVEITGLEMDTEYEYTIIGIKDGEANEGTTRATFTTLSENDKIFMTAGDWDVADNWSPAGVPTAENIVFVKADAIIPDGVIATANTITIDGGSITIKDGGELKSNSYVEVTLEKEIAGYGNGEGKFNFISSPVATSLAPDDIDGLLEGDYDFYRFVRTMNLEWRSYALTSFSMTAGNGALYANKEATTLKFTGETWTSVDNYLSMSVAYNESYPMSMILAGNPFPCTGTIYFQDGNNNLSGIIYKLNAAGDGFDAYYGWANVAPGEAVLVEYDSDGNIYFESEDYGDGEALGAVDYIVLPKHGVMGTNPDAGPVVELANDSDNNSAYVKYYKEKNVIVKLAGRTLYKDGKWNTLCLPFNVTLAGSPLEGAVAKTLTDATITGDHVTLTFGEAVETLTAGTPYIIKWESGENINDPMFTYTTITAEEGQTISLADEKVEFTGYYDAFPIEPEDGFWYLTGDNTLKQTAVERMLKACRAFFLFSDEISAARSFTLDFGEGGISTSIDRLPAELTGEGEWYSVDGMKLAKQPTRKGVYVKNGKKIVVK